MELRIDNEDQKIDERSDKLKKAIERNRAKQAKRDSRSGQEKTSPQLPSKMPPSFFEQDVDPDFHVDPTLENQVQTQSIQNGMADDFTLGEEEFEEYEEFEEEEQVATGLFSHFSNLKEKSDALILDLKEGNYIDYLVYLGWIFCCFLFIRLIVTERGVIEYYSKNSVLSEKKTAISQTEEENIFILKEIDLIKNDKAYQKKLVRDVLGFIAKDEHLVLFPKKGKKKSK